MTAEQTTRCEEIYSSPSPNFWGQQATSLVRDLCATRSVAGLRVLDVGCGEGRNAAYLAGHGAEVRAVDFSEAALARAIAIHGRPRGVHWEQADVTSEELPDSWYDVVIVYSMTHWLADAHQVQEVMQRLRRATKGGGTHLYCAFNDRVPYPHAAAHRPTLLSHRQHLDLFDGWEVLRESDTDLDDVHPGEAPHIHAMSRVVARRPL